MSLDCGSCIAKYLLCFFNFIIFLAGTVILGVGIWLAVDKKSFIALTKVVNNEQLGQFSQPAVIEQASYILIAAGAFMFVVSFLGYCGAIRESKCLLTTYGICLILILILEITAGGLAAGYKNEAKQKTQEYLKATIRSYYGTGNETDAVSLMWNHLMAQLQCCGVDDYRDFHASEKWNRYSTESGKVIPDACCVLKGDKTLFQPLNPNCPRNMDDSYSTNGCYEALIKWMTTHLNIIIGVGVGLGLLELVGIFLAFCLCKTIDSYLK